MKNWTLSLLAPSTVATFIAAASSADIGFPAAVELCRGAVPQATLLQIELRERDNILVYEGDMYTAELVTNWDPRFHPETGALIQLDVDSVDASDIPTLSQIFARFDEVVLDFADAINAAAAVSSGSPEQKIQIDIEADIVAYQVEYFDLSKVYVDASTGGIIPHHGQGDDFEDTLSAAVMTATTEAAIAFAGEGWTLFETEAEDESSNADYNRARFFDAKGSTVLEVRVGVDGTVLSSSTFSPTSSMSSRISQILSYIDTMNVSATDAIAVADGSYAGAGFHEVELKVEQGNLWWKVELVTADLIEIDVWVDASAEASFMYATAPVNELIGDFNGDGAISGADLTELLGGWGTANGALDLDGNGSVGGGDLALLLGAW